MKNLHAVLGLLLITSSAHSNDDYHYETFIQAVSLIRTEDAKKIILAEKLDEKIDREKTTGVIAGASSVVGGTLIGVGALHMLTTLSSSRLAAAEAAGLMTLSSTGSLLAIGGGHVAFNEWRGEQQKKYEKQLLGLLSKRHGTAVAKRVFLDYKAKKLTIDQAAALLFDDEHEQGCAKDIAYALTIDPHHYETLRLNIEKSYGPKIAGELVGLLLSKRFNESELAEGLEKEFPLISKTILRQRASLESKKSIPVIMNQVESQGYDQKQAHKHSQVQGDKPSSH